jgi:glycerophosphoryl diester phosphodiesterase
MRLISHRGAKGYADENSLASIKIASELKIDYIEIDIQFTQNNVIVVQHDNVTPKGKIVKDNTYKTLQREISYMPTLREALRESADKPVIIESKAHGTIAKSLNIIKDYPKSVVASSLPEEILAARIHLPSNKTYLIKNKPVFGAIKLAKQIDASGIAFNYLWGILIPYYYYLARKNSLDICLYTVNNKIIARIISKFMPKIYICTDYPKKMLGMND